jgi:hypothetical protein
MNEQTATANKQRMLMEILGAKPIAFNPQLARLCGSVKAGLFLSQLLYWTNKTEDEWIYKTIAEFEEETALSREEQDGAIRRLKQLGFIEVEVRGMPARRYFKADCVKVANQFAENTQTRLCKTLKLYTDSTTENTTDTLTNKLVKAEFGNSAINSVSGYFLSKLGIPKEDCTQRQSRQYWNLLLKESKTGADGVKWLIDLAAGDKFYRNHITSSKDLYYKRVKLVAAKRGTMPRVAVME